MMKTTDRIAEIKFKMDELQATVKSQMDELQQELDRLREIQMLENRIAALEKENDRLRLENHWLWQRLRVRAATATEEDQ